MLDPNANLENKVQINKSGSVGGMSVATDWEDGAVGTGVNFDFGVTRDEAARTMDPTADDVRRNTTTHFYHQSAKYFN